MIILCFGSKVIKPKEEQIKTFCKTRTTTQGRRPKMEVYILLYPIRNNCNYLFVAIVLKDNTGDFFFTWQPLITWTIIYLKGTFVTPVVNVLNLILLLPLSYLPKSSLQKAKFSVTRVLGSVTRLGYFWNFLAANFHTKVAQFFVQFLGSLWKRHCLSKNYCSYF